MKSLFIFILLILCGCQSTQRASSNDLDETLKDIATYDVDLGSQSLLLISGDYLDSYETSQHLNIYRIYILKNKANYINLVMEEKCSSLGGEVYKYEGVDIYQRYSVCESRADKDIQLFGYGMFYEPLQKSSYNGWIFKYYELKNSSSLPQSDFPNYTLREAKLAQVKAEEARIKQTQEALKLKNKLYREAQARKDIEGLRQKSVTTRRQVFTKGTRICSVTLNHKTVGFTEDSTDKKIQIRVGSSLIWDWPDNWYSCDRD